MATSWNKKERENKKREERRKKEEKRQERKGNAANGKNLIEMMAYLDENGNLTSVPPADNRKRIEIKAEDIEIGVPKQKELTKEDLIRKGTVTFFNSAKGFGFIEDSENGQRIFVHQSSSSQPLQEGLKVVFEIERGPRGYTAANVSTSKN